MGTRVSPHTVTAWLDDLGMGLHKIQKAMAGGEYPTATRSFNASRS